MLRLDFWNNPLVIKAMRVHYRHGRLLTMSCSYFLILVLLGFIWLHYSGRPADASFARNYFVAVLAIQAVIGPLRAAVSISTSMQQEVTTRTLDFQRITSLPPRAILIGKLLGEPASSYFLTIATFPIAVFCYALGGVSAPAIPLFYLSLLTTTLMFGALALNHPLEFVEGRPNQAGGLGCLLGIIFFCIPVFLNALAGGFFTQPWAQGLFGLFTPALAIRGLYENNPLLYKLPLYSGAVPYLYVTPLFQCIPVVLSLLWMTRRLEKPLHTPASKVQTYLTLALLEEILCLFLFHETFRGGGLAWPAFDFAIGHVVLSVILVRQISPNFERLSSWIWRYRGRRSYLVDLLIGERTPSVLALVVLWLIGVAVFFGGLALPDYVVNGSQNWAKTDWRWVGAILVLMGLLSGAFGLLHQVCILALGRSGGGTAFLIGIFVVAAPWAWGYGYGEALVSALSPIGLFYEVSILFAPDLPAEGVQQLLAAFRFGMLFYGVASVLLGGFVCWIVRRASIRVDHTIAGLHGEGQEKIPGFGSASVR